MSRYIILLLLALSAPAGAYDLSGLKAKLNGLVKPANPAGSPLSKFSTKDQVDSLRQALTEGTGTAVSGLSRKNGFLGNDRVRIPLPHSVQKADKVMRKFGMGKYSDELVTAMNRAAEAAVPEAKTLFVGAIKQMTVSDAKKILTGKDDAATQYFRRHTETALTTRFTPVVDRSMKQVKLAETYDRFAGKAAKFGLIDKRDAKLDDYITRKTMDGLFLMIADQEKAIRADPLKATSSLVQQVFAAVRK